MPVNKDNAADSEYHEQIEDKYIVTQEKDSVIVTRIKDGASLFMQGDDAALFLREVDAIEDAEIRNYAISQYDEVFDKVDAELTSEIKSIVSAEEIVDKQGTRPILKPSLDGVYSGKTLGASDQHVVFSLGRCSLIVEKKNLDRVPGEGEIVEMKFSGGKGVIKPEKGVDRGR